jgi:hypothetical protein
MEGQQEWKLNVLLVLFVTRIPTTIIEMLYNIFFGFTTGNGIYRGLYKCKNGVGRLRPIRTAKFSAIENT